MYRCSKLSELSILFGCLATLFLLVQCEYSKEKYSVGLFAAFAVGSNSKRQQCMGTCYGNNQVCRVGRNDIDVGTDCKVSNQFVARYYTVYSSGKTQLCMSDCSNFGGSTKRWCVTDSNWYECTTEIPRRLTRYTVSTNKASSPEVVYAADNPTDAGTRCVSYCSPKDSSWSTFECYDTKKKLVKCYPSPDATKLVKSFHEYARRFPYKIDDKDQLVPCPVKRHVRQRRDTDDNDTRKLRSIFNGMNTVEEMATQVSNWFPVETLRWPDPDIYPDPSTEPIVEYAVRIAPIMTGIHQIILPMMVRAIYSNNTIPTLERSSGYNEFNYGYQNPRRGEDEHGHLVSHQLGGTEDPYNIVPQSMRMNRGGTWNRLERIMRNFIYSNRRGTVEHTVVVNYDFTTSYRPTSFAIRVRFFDENRQLVNKDGRRLPNFAANEYENVYLINEDTPCGT